MKKRVQNDSSMIMRTKHENTVEIIDIVVLSSFLPLQTERQYALYFLEQCQGDHLHLLLLKTTFNEQ